MQDAKAKARELLREIARSHEMTISAGAINRDQGYRACVGVWGRAILKGEEFPQAMSEYRSLRKRYRGQHLWGRGYRVATAATSLTRYGRSTLRIPTFSCNPKRPPLGGG